MRFIFSPALGLMNRLRYRSKFLLLGSALVAILLLLVVTLFTTLSRDIQTAENELVGLQMLKPMNRAVQYMQQHRGLSSGILNGNEAMKPRRENVAKEVAAALSAADSILPPRLRESEVWRSIRADWGEISQQGLSWPAPINLKRHTAMISRLLTFMVDVADETQLTLDPVLDTYYFMDTVVSKMPAMLEPMGIMRARGTGVLSAQALSPEMQRGITVLLERMNGTLIQQNANLEKVMNFAPELRPALAGPSREFTEASEKIFKLVQEDILGERFTTSPADYFALTTQTIDLGYKMMFETLIPQFEKQLLKRKSEAERILMLEIALTVLVLLLVGYLGVGAYYSVIDTVEGVSSAAKRMAAGDMTVEFVTGGQDELHAAGRDLNDMVASIRHLMARIQEDVGHLRGAAGDLATSSHQISRSAGAQSDSASSMAASVEEMTVGVDHIARNAQDAESYSRESDRVASDGAVSIRKLSDEIERIAATVNQSAAAVESLG